MYNLNSQVEVLEFQISLTAIFVAEVLFSFYHLLNTLNRNGVYNGKLLNTVFFDIISMKLH